MTVIEQVAYAHRAAERVARRRIAARTSRPFLQLRALRALRREEIHTQAALAERLRIDPPAASRLVDRLVADGLVTRKEGADRRCVCLTLTKAADAEVAIVDEALAQIEQELRAHLRVEDLRKLAPLMRRVADALDALE
jgi:MarR family transcriptional regulator for hemolysin